MTYKERLIKEHPCEDVDSIIKLRCPDNLGYTANISCAPGRDCIACWDQETQETKESIETSTNPIRFKIFFGDHNTMSSSYVDHQVNTWLDANPNIDILDFKYCESDSKHHSICIMYKEVKES